jgi:GT2 family glycosyltransferase
VPDLSIIIVNYNVKYYIQQCLDGLLNVDALHLQIIVVDNNSTDGSQQLLEGLYGGKIELICNPENIGFGKASNIGLAKAQAKYSLFLNPDTKVSIRVLKEVISFAESNPIDLGLVGVRMTDSKNQFLPESKRGLPRPDKAFYKLSGINNLFLNSEKVNAYYAPNVGEFDRSEVDILTGAFLFGESDLLKELNGFDEAFFMYGEDIDLSYRALKKGKKNYYLGDQTIIHYKGKSTNYKDISYVKRFYSAMSLFHKKHFTKEYSWLLNVLVLTSIQVQIFLKSAARVLSNLFFPFIEASLFLVGTYVCQKLWGNYFFNKPNYYAGLTALSHAFFATSMWVMTLFLLSSYRFYRNIFKYALGLILGLSFILMLYSLFSVDWRTSRALFFFYFLWNIILGTLLRLLIGNKTSAKNKRLGILGSAQFIDRLSSLQNVYSSLNIHSSSAKSEFDKGTVDHLFIQADFIQPRDLAEIMVSNTEEGISTRLLSIEDIYSLIEQSKEIGIQHLFNENQGFAIQFLENRVVKRCFDFLLSILLLPFSFFLSKVSYTTLRSVISGKKSLIGYSKQSNNSVELPNIKEGVFEISNLHSKELNHIHNFDYAMNYSVLKDFRCFINSILSESKN